MFWKNWKFNLSLFDGDSELGDVESLPSKKPSSSEEKPRKKHKEKKTKAEQTSLDSDYKPKKPSLWDHLILNKKVRIFYVMVLCAALGIGLPSAISYFLSSYSVDLYSCTIDPDERFECLSGARVVTADTCSKAGCCWDPSPAANIRCFHTLPTRYSYTVDTVNKVVNSSSLSVVHLVPQFRDKDPFQQELPKAFFDIRAVNKHHLILRFYSEKDPPPEYRLLTENKNLQLNETDFNVYYTQEPNHQFGVVINRNNTKETLIDTSKGPMIVSDGYVEFSLVLPNRVLFGFGQDRHASIIRSFEFTRLSMYNRKRSEGFHPFYMLAEESGLVHGVFWDNMYPLEVQLTPIPAVVYRAMGGSAVIHLFSGPTPKDVSNQYVTDLVGTIQLPPYWALGFHLCRESDNQTAFDVTFEAMNRAEIGFDSDCIDFRLSGSTALNVDLTNFPAARNQTKQLADANKKFLLNQNPHVLVTSNDLQSVPVVTYNSQTYHGSINNLQVAYPSFPRPSTLSDKDFELDFSRLMDPDGIYFSYNSPLNENKDSCPSDVKRPFYLEALKPDKLSENSICLDALHDNETKHIEMHNIYGVSHMNMFRRQYMQNRPHRVLTMNQASTLGNLGKAGYAGEDFEADWVEMRAALVQVLEMGFFGIPLAGAPICGSLNSSAATAGLTSRSDQERLCLRWFQMGIFLPFAHSLNRLGHKPRSPVDWSRNAQGFIKGYIRERYALLPYIYTLFYEASKWGYPVVRPLFYEFPLDNNTYRISDQFMLGSSIMVCPIMYPSNDPSGTSLRQVYFPNATWFDYHTGDVIFQGSGNATISSAAAQTNVFLRSGTIIIQQVGKNSAESSRGTNYTITAAFPLNEDGTITSHLYIDDGVAKDPLYDLIEFTFTNTSIDIVVKTNDFTNEVETNISTIIDTIRVLGIDRKPSNISSNENEILFDYDSVYRVLRIHSLNYNWTSHNLHLEIEY